MDDGSDTVNIYRNVSKDLLKRRPIRRENF